MPLGDSNRASLAGLTLEDVLANRAAAVAAAKSSNQLTSTKSNRKTLLDIIREDETPSKKDRTPWRTFKDKLLLKRTGSAWTSSVLIPASDIPFPIRNYRNFSTQLPRRSSIRILTFSPVDVETSDRMADPTEEAIKSSNFGASMMSRQRSTRQQVGDAIFVDEKMSRPGSSRMPSLRADSARRERVVTFRDGENDEDDEEGDGQNRPKEDRQMSAREAVAAQEAAEAAAAMAGEVKEDEEDGGSEDAEEGGGMTMSLMDLLEETDRQMGLEGSSYRMEDEEGELVDGDFEEEEEGYEEGEEHDCCVCMVKHRGSPFEPCGHSFCRMCSRELTAIKGNCPNCNKFLLEILQVF